MNILEVVIFIAAIVAGLLIAPIIVMLLTFSSMCSKERLGYTCRHSAGECDKELKHE